MGEESELVERHLPCPDEEGCGSSDAFCTYDDSHGFCFACNKAFRAGSFEGSEGGLRQDGFFGKHRVRPRVSEDVTALIDNSDHRAITRWGISQATCRHWDYRVRVSPRGDMEHLAIYRDEHGSILDVKVRNTGPEGNDKDFYWASGHAPKGALYGAHLLGNGGKMVVVTAGEKDALTISQLWGNKFPVVSPPNGEPAAAKDLAHWIGALCRYEKVVICWDQDETGQKTLPAVARLFPPGKAFIAKLPAKDANEVSQMAGGAEKLIAALHNAAPYRPDGIVDADDIDDQLLNPTQWGLSLPWQFLTDWTYGMLPGQVWMLGAGTGIGKSDFAAEIVVHLIKPKEDGGEWVPVAVFNYEAGPVRSLKTIVGKLWNKRFNIPPPKGPDGEPRWEGFVYWQPEDLAAARTYRREKCAKLFINDHKGAIDWASVKERLRYLKHAAGIRVGVVDPVAALSAGEDDERKALDRLFAEAKALAEELEITLLFVSHLARPKDGKSHEEGGRVALNQFRGSGAIVMWASYVIVLERDQQGDEEDRKETTLRMLKDRETGDSTGMTRSLVYNTLNGRQEEMEAELDRGIPEPPPLEVE